jgi:hypothetical protein
LNAAINGPITKKIEIKTLNLRLEERSLGSRVQKNKN